MNTVGHTLLQGIFSIQRLFASADGTDSGRIDGDIVIAKMAFIYEQRRQSESGFINELIDFETVAWSCNQRRKLVSVDDYCDDITIFI
jgi:hypothetical protein